MSDTVSRKRPIGFVEASQVESDDFLLIDGSTNGTRKIKPDKVGKAKTSDLTNDAGFQNATEVAAAISANIDTTLATSGKAADAKAVGDALATKVDSVSGKVLSDNNYTTEEKTKLAGVATGATRVLIDDDLTDSGKAADAAAVGTALATKVDKEAGKGLVAIDTTLTTTGKAADAKKTGDEISGLKSQLTHHPIGYTDIVSSMVDEDYFAKTISGTATYQYVSKSVTLPAGDYIITLYDMHIPSVGYFQIGLTLNSAEILGHTTAEGKYEFTLSAETTIIPKMQINLGDGVTAGTYYVRYAIYNASSSIIPEYATGVWNCVKKDGTGEVQTKNIYGMKETDEFIDSDNLFSTDLLKYEGKYPYISGSTGKIVYGGNADFNTYLMPVSGGIYNFMFVSYGVLLEADQETAIGSWIQSATQINTTGASYLAFSFKPSVYSPSNYVVTEKIHIWETPKEWRLNTNNYSKYVSKEGSIASGDSFYIDDIGTGLKDGYIVAFKGYITSFGSIKLGFGSATNAITVDSTNVTIKNGYTADVVLSHGLTIANELSFIFELIKGVANITVGSNGGLFKTTVDWVQLNASNGTPTIISTSTVMTDCELRVVFNAAERKTWVLGDSYISVESNRRWTYYLNQYDWFTNSLFQGVPGMYSSSNVTALKRLLRFGKPKRIVFASGMNDGTDGENDPNTNWKNARDEFLSVCEAEGIEPIFATVPTVTGANPPTTLINNEKKNTWIRGSGYRYIDFAKAVGANSSGVWYSGMLGSDGVHPTEQGAKALFTQAITDLPELMINE